MNYLPKWFYLKLRLAIFSSASAGHLGIIWRIVGGFMIESLILILVENFPLTFGDDYGCTGVSEDVYCSAAHV